MLTANIILIVAIVFILIYLASTLLLYFLKASRKTPEEDTPDWATKEAYELMQNATQKAEDILTGAETESLKIATSAKLGTELFETEYSKKLDGALKESLDQYKSLISTLEKTSLETQKETEEAMKTRINSALLSFEQNLSNYLSQAEQKSFESINLELRSARSLIDTYKTQQLQLIDENIIAVLERTLSLVLRNKISLKDQMDLVFEALEKAKIEKFFA